MDVDADALVAGALDHNTHLLLLLKSSLLPRPRPLRPFSHGSDLPKMSSVPSQQATAAAESSGANESEEMRTALPTFVTNGEGEAKGEVETQLERRGIAGNTDGGGELTKAEGVYIFVTCIMLSRPSLNPMPR